MPLYGSIALRFYPTVALAGGFFAGAFLAGIFLALPLEVDAFKSAEGAN